MERPGPRIRPASRIEARSPCSARVGVVADSLDEALEAEILRNRKVLVSKEPETASPEAPGVETAPAVNFCPECGQAAVETDNYCSGCGKTLR